MNSFFLTFLVAFFTVASAASSMNDSPFFQKFGAFKKMSASHSAKGKIALDAAATFPSDPKYAIVEMYNAANCTHYIQAMSVLLDTCMTNGVTSVKYTCNDQQLNIYNYENDACNTLVGIEGYSAQCTSPEDLGGRTVQMTVCGTSKAYDFPGSTVVMGNYQSETCNEQSVGGFGAKNLHCFPNQDDDALGSSEFDWPYWNVYNTADCSGPQAEHHKLTDEPCGLDNSMDAVNANTYFGYSFKSAAFSNASIGMAAIFSTLMAVFYSMKN